MAKYSDFGLEARKIMLQRGIKMKQVADELGISVTYVGEIFKGTRPGTKYKPLIAKMLGMESEVRK